ncbi:hypothetical protein OIU84_011482 [Salix udensis]|uniref:Ubiquitin thioesterase OTU n=1 Tax=Salix udensis TaxID=889485 RepID=A0AAD6NX14_9ROSI|nr:hypothetical protein OIU84_011482 [Salix udensis]
MGSLPCSSPNQKKVPLVFFVEASFVLLVRYCSRFPNPFTVVGSLLEKRRVLGKTDFGFDSEESGGNVEIEDFLSVDLSLLATYTICIEVCPGNASMTVCSAINTCVKNVANLSGRVQQMGSTILNVVPRGQSTSCCFSFNPSRSRSNYSHLSVSKTFSCPSISFHMLHRKCFGSDSIKQRANLLSLTVKGVVNSGGPLKRQFNISLPCQNMTLRFSVSKRGLLSKIKGNVGSISWSQKYTTTGIIFGLLVCYSSSEPTHAEAATQKNKVEDICNSSDIKFSHGKKVYTDYSITGIPGDGRCLFRSVAHGACLRSGKRAPSESLQRELADDLRSEVADEFIKRREETEWFIEGNFDTYVSQMRKPHVWGGEPELLMASHVLKMPITVYMDDKNARGFDIHCRVWSGVRDGKSNWSSL